MYVTRDQHNDVGGVLSGKLEAVKLTSKEKGDHVIDDNVQGQLLPGNGITSAYQRPEYVIPVGRIGTTLFDKVTTELLHKLDILVVLPVSFAHQGRVPPRSVRSPGDFLEYGSESLHKWVLVVSVEGVESGSHGATVICQRLWSGTSATKARIFNPIQGDGVHAQSRETILDVDTLFGTKPRPL